MNLAVNSAGMVAVSPVLIVVLCAVAGIGTVLLLPARREKAIRKFGGAIVAVAGVVLASVLVRLAAAASPADPMGCYFWVFGTIAVGSALRVVTHPRPVYSALYFVLTVFASAGLFVLLWAEFMAAALVLIYAGAILVTYVFVIMLAARAGGTGGGELSEADTASREPLAACIVGFGLMALLIYAIFDKAPAAMPVWEQAAPGNTNITVNGLARYLFQHQLINLELAGVILTMAMVGAVIIAKRRIWTPLETEAKTPTFEIGDDNPLNIPIVGTSNPKQKAYPEQ